MSNIRKVSVFLLLFFLFCFCGCKTEQDNISEAPLSNGSNSVKHYVVFETPLLNYFDPAGYDVSNYFLGELPQTALPVTELSVSVENGMCIYDGLSYRKMTSSPNSNTFPWSGWQLDCSYLESLGKTKLGELVYGVKDGKTISSIVLLGGNGEQKFAQWFVLEGLDAIDVNSLTIDDFYVQKAYGEEDTKNTLSTIWSLHIGKSYDHAEDWLLEWPVCHMFFLVSKDAPWLVYELNYCYESEDSNSLYFYNANVDGIIRKAGKTD